MAEITSVGFIKETTLWFRDVISGAVADPVADRQAQSGDPGSNANFVMTSWPERPVVFPYVTVSHIDNGDTQLGMQTNDTQTDMVFQVDVWTKQVTQRDGIAGSVAHAVRTNALEAVPSGLFDLRLSSMRNQDEPGKGGVHRKILTYNVSFIHTG